MKKIKINKRRLKLRLINKIHKIITKSQKNGKIEILLKSKNPINEKKEKISKWLKLGLINKIKKINTKSQKNGKIEI